jgi:F0F1-type ATP synthase membrane subunit b/b'
MSRKNILEKPIESPKCEFLDDGVDPDTLHFISSLIDQNSELASKLKHVESLLKIATQSVNEAKRQLATAKAEAERIIAEANQTAAEVAKEKLSSATQLAQQIVEEAEGVQRRAEVDSKRMISEVKQVDEAAKKQAEEIMNAAAAQAASTRALAEHEAHKILVDATKTDKEEALNVRKEAEQTLGSGKKLGDSETIESFAEIHNRLHAAQGVVGQKHDITTLGPEPSVEEEIPVLYEGTVDLLVQPPITINGVSKLLTHLKQIHGIGILDLKQSSNRSICVKLLVRARAPLLSILKEMPEVDRVNAPSRQVEKVAAVRSVSVTMREVKPWYRSH